MSYILSGLIIAQPFTSKLSRYGINSRADLPAHGHGLGACDITVSSSGRITSIAPTAPSRTAVINPATVTPEGYEDVSLDRSRVIDEAQVPPSTSPSHPSIPKFNFQNCFAWPGLIDSSVHSLPPLLDSTGGGARLLGLLNLSHGITSVREVGVESESASSQLALDAALGRTLGPRHFWVGKRIGGESGESPNTPALPKWLTVTGLEEERAGDAVKASAEAGACGVEIGGSATAEELDGAAVSAGELKLPLIGHVPYHTPVRFSCESATTTLLCHLVWLAFITPPTLPLLHTHALTVRHISFEGALTPLWDPAFALCCVEQFFGRCGLALPVRRRCLPRCLRCLVRHLEQG